MPQALIAWITPYVASAIFGITASTAIVVAATGIVSAALVYGAIALAGYLATMAFAPAKPAAPKPEDGKINFKQSVPPLVYILGQVKKAGDYALLEERGGIAFHVFVDAAHHIKGYVRHFLHDEAVNLTGGAVTIPQHFDGYVFIDSRRGENNELAYGQLISTFPEIWTEDHRGDGLATVLMQVGPATPDDLQTVYPQHMPQRSSQIEGHDELYDPRTDDRGYSTNIAIFRLWHLTHPVGGKLALDDLYMPDWATAADVADMEVEDREGDSLSRYHGGLWFRANNDPVQIGQLLDQAADLVIYERADGKIGVHAGVEVDSDVRLTIDDIIHVNFDTNKRRSSQVLAVRGQFTDPERGYNTIDAAPYGDPYLDDTQRTKAVNNQAVQHHNHISRLMKLAYNRGRAPRVTILAHFEPARQVPYRRFVKVHFPPKLDEAWVEIIGRPTLSLATLTYEFEGIVVPADLYAFDPAIDEGVPATMPGSIERANVPAPENFDVTIETEGGNYYANGTVDFQDASFTYELEWEPVIGGAAMSAESLPGQLTIRSNYLGGPLDYKIRARTWSAGVFSDWTAYETRSVP